jgi:hypothetical protein
MSPLRKEPQHDRHTRPGNRRTRRTAHNYVWYTCWDTCYGHPGRGCYELRACEVTRVTNKRIYFRDDIERYSEREQFVDRATIEREGSVYHRGQRQFLYLEPPELHDYRPKSLSELRREMADHHPDRGGDPAEFRVAHARYTAAKTR